jgi:RNA polymerase sigma-70 factor (ECF subfamily)
MDPTSHTLLQQIQAKPGDSWMRLDSIYRPFLYRWLRKHGIEHSDAEDLVQEVLMAVAGELPGFVHSGRPGAFRHWLRTIALHRAQAFWRARSLRARVAGGTEFQEFLERWQDPDGRLRQEWDREHDRHLLQYLLQQVASEFEPKTMQAFRRLALEQLPPAEVASELGLTVGAVYIAKSRVLRRLRTLAEGMIDELHFS